MFLFFINALIYKVLFKYNLYLQIINFLVKTISQSDNGPHCEALSPRFHQKLEDRVLRNLKDFKTDQIQNYGSFDSDRQQLLYWLKGETHAKPSIDKLLIYQWQDYEIGIGLKYSGQMGGDFYDLFQLPTANADNQVGVFISDFGLLVGDLAGHGVETALNLSKTHIFLAETDLSHF